MGERGPIDPLVEMNRDSASTNRFRCLGESPAAATSHAAKRPRQLLVVCCKFRDVERAAHIEMLCVVGNTAWQAGAHAMYDALEAHAVGRAQQMTGTPTVCTMK